MSTGVTSRERVAQPREVLEVARQRRRVARDVDDAPRRELGAAHDDARVEARARRIHHHARRAGSRPARWPSAHSRSTCRASPQTNRVVRAARCASRCGAPARPRPPRDSTPTATRRRAREQQRQRARAAVQVEHRLVAAQLRGLERERVELLRLRAVRLQERVAHDLELEPEQPLDDRARADQRDLALHERDVGARRVDAQRHRLHLGRERRDRGAPSRASPGSCSEDATGARRTRRVSCRWRTMRKRATPSRRPWW